MFSNAKTTKIFHLKARDKYRFGVQQIISEKMRRKYCTSTNYYYISSIDQYQTAQPKAMFNEIGYDYDEEFMIKYSKLQQTTKEIEQLTEYYKYYTQKSILFFKQYFELLLHYQEKKKIVEYNRLKVVLGLDSSQIGLKKETNQHCQSSKIVKDRSKRSYPSVNPVNTNNNILSELDTTNPTLNYTDQSVMLIRMRNKLSQYIGHTQTKTLAEIDSNYSFPKKYQNRISRNFNKNLETKLKKIQKNTINTINSQTKKYNKCKNNSCDLRPMDKAIAVYGRNPRKKKNLSMDNFPVETRNSSMPKKQKKGVVIQQYKKKQKDREKYDNTFRTNIHELKSKIQRQKQKIKRSYIKSYTGSNESTNDKFIAKKNIFY